MIPTEPTTGAPRSMPTTDARRSVVARERTRPFRLWFAKASAETIKTWLEIAGMVAGMLGIGRLWRRWRRWRAHREEEEKRQREFHAALPALQAIPGHVEGLRGEVRTLHEGMRHVAEITGQHGALTEIMAQDSATPLWRANAAGLCTWVNHAFEEAVGVGAREILGINWKQRLHPADRDNHIEAWEEAVRLSQPFVARCRFVRADGGIVAVLVEGKPRFDPGGTVTGYTGSLRVLAEKTREGG